MNQKLMVVDNFYEVAHKHHKSFFENECTIDNETVEKITYLLDKKVEIIGGFNEACLENTQNLITCNIDADFIAVVYLTMPPDCVFKQGISFYKHVKTNLEMFPDETAKEKFGFSSLEDIQKSFSSNNFSDWKEYCNIFVKYNRLILFQASLWHSYGSGFGSDLNNGMLYQKILLKNVK